MEIASEEQSDPNTVTFSLEQNGIVMEITYDNWPAFVLMMRRMGPLWHQSPNLEVLMNRVQSVIG